MKRTYIFLVLWQVSLINYGQIIADHRIVADYDKIPQQYIDAVKKMWVEISGASHGTAYCYGADYLELLDNKFQAYYQSSGTPEGNTSLHLRINQAMWGNYLNETGWIHYNGHAHYNESILFH